MIPTIVGVAGAVGVVGYGICLGTGFQISYWLGSLLKKTVAWIKAKYQAIKDILLARVNIAFNKVDEIAKRYPNVKWTEKALVKLAQIFARIVYGTPKADFMAYVMQEKESVVTGVRNQKPTVNFTRPDSNEQSKQEKNQAGVECVSAFNPNFAF